MRKTACLLIVILIALALLNYPLSVSAEGTKDWSDEPIITKVYESGKEQIIVEWEGIADFYYVYLDGKKAATVNLNYAILNVKRGRHQLQILPIKLESKEAESTFGFDVSLPLPEILSFLGDGLDASANVDLSAFGIDPKNILQGTRSSIFTLNYNISYIVDSVPEIVDAVTDFGDNVVLSFVDKYDSDSYGIGIKSGKDITHVEFDRSSPMCSEWIDKNNSNVTLVLNRQYLQSQGCMIPELGEKYSFTVRLGKYSINQVSGEPEIMMLLGSKDSKAFSYTPVAAWKTAPEITYASQTADGQITLRWTHETNGLNCEYEIVRIDRILGVKKGEDVLGKTTEHEFAVDDLMNGKYELAVVPVYATEKGDTSDEASVEVANSWVAAPELSCETLSDKKVRLTWTAASGVESYHIIVYAGSGSALRFVNLDYKKYQEIDVPATDGQMEYVFEYGDELVTDNGVRLRFEIYAVRHAANGTEQKSSVSKQALQIQLES